MNAGLLLLLTVISFNMAKGAIEMSFLSYMMPMMLGVGILGVANAVVALVLARKGRKDLALSFLLSAIFVGLVGTGLCFGGPTWWSRW